MTRGATLTLAAPFWLSFSICPKGQYQCQLQRVGMHQGNDALKSSEAGQEDGKTREDWVSCPFSPPSLGFGSLQSLGRRLRQSVSLSV